MALTGLCDVAGLARAHEPPPRVRSVLTRIHKIRVSTTDLAERIERLLPGTLCRARIPEDARVVDSPDFGLPVTLSERRCRASLAYQELTEELYPLLVNQDGPMRMDRTTRASRAFWPNGRRRRSQARNWSLMRRGAIPS